MIFETCSEIRGHFSEYIDGACAADAIHSIRYHLAHCVPCTSELERYEALQTELRGLSRQQVSPHLALRLRVQLSQELHRNFFQRLLVHLENIFRPVLFPSVAGSLLALVCIALMLGAEAPHASSVPDVPFVTPPRVQVLPPVNLGTGAQPLVLVTFINAQGRVTNYKIISGQQTPGLIQRLDQMMYYSLFQPATSFGEPTSGQVVLSFRTITVRG
ncbi:MAG TPA: zf-HC2 domain-containing protein [Terriglobia bacterium]|nr:zf-HC2 domain-containing protein [Terriglobia bacterium]